MPAAKPAIAGLTRHRKADVPDDYHQHYVGGGKTEWHQHTPPLYPPMSPAWIDGYRKGMEYCLATLQPLLRADADNDAIREAVRMLHGQLPVVPTPEPDITGQPTSGAIAAAKRRRDTAHDYQSVPSNVGG